MGKEDSTNLQVNGSATPSQEDSAGPPVPTTTTSSFPGLSFTETLVTSARFCTVWAPGKAS